MDLYRYMLSSVEIPKIHRSGNFAKSWENRSTGNTSFQPFIAHFLLICRLECCGKRVVPRTEEGRSKWVKNNYSGYFWHMARRFQTVPRDENWHFSGNQHLPVLHFSPSERYHIVIWSHRIRFGPCIRVRCKISHSNTFCNEKITLSLKQITNKSSHPDNPRYGYGRGSMLITKTDHISSFWRHGRGS